MPFPQVKRVKYSKTPLENVICQVRFPSILEIDSQTPYLFQNKIRKEFPIYNETVEVQQDINLPITNPIANPMTNISSNKNYEFISENGDWRINLTRTFMSISTTNYSTWEDFLNKFLNAFNGLVEIYNPAFFTRIGLRYVDVFCRSTLGLEKYEWSKLIQPSFLGILGSEVSKNVSEFNSVCEVKCDDNMSMIRIATNLVNRLDTNEQCFLMDSDVYTTQKVQLKEMESKLTYLHDRSSRLVRFAITEELHEGMGPQEI